LAQNLIKPATSELFATVETTPAVQLLARRLEDGGVFSLSGICSAGQPFLAAVLRRVMPERPIVVVTEGLRTQETFHQDLVTWLDFQAADALSPPAPPLFYPDWEILPQETRLPHVDVISERLQTLVALQSSAVDHSAKKPAPVVVTNVRALLQRTFSAARLGQQTRALARGERCDPLDLSEWLQAQGYEAEAQVTQKGELALRGGILDIYPLTSPWPVRLEFFGDELESLRHFDPLTQVSREEIGSVPIPPAGELGLLRKLGEAQTGPDTPPSAVAGPAPQSLATLLDYLPEQTVWLLCEPEQLAERAEEYGNAAGPEDPFFASWEALQAQALKRRMAWVEVAELELPLWPNPLEADEPATVEIEESEPAASIEPVPEWETSTSVPADLHRALRIESMDACRPLSERAPEPQVAEAQRREFFNQLHRWLRQGYAVHVFCNNDGERQRFAEIWTEYGLGSAPHELPQLHIGVLARGFVYDAAKLVVVTDAEIFGRYKVQRPRRLKSPHAQALRSALDIDFSDLEEGDYVVHLQHGIGRYLGLQVLPLGAGTKPTEGTVAQSSAGQECLVLEYAPNDAAQPPPKLYVPVTEAHLVSKYVGTGKARPPLNTLGGTRWAKAKAQAERAVRDVASDLLAIQAARESQPGHAFAPDAPWQREFEGSFVYEETPDQMRAIVETKADMERPKPMDRLICGDVGFGKTEVGIRAAFKAVMDGRQVAVLVPTTVLAQQHYNTFRERMADYPVRIELLSRFRSRRAQQKVVSDLAAGAVDIVIGTHRLVQKDIAFKDLGLVVIDEEQRFGVMHKEKFKMLRRLVDVLTLSATPIPRTLYLALTGARDMSTIQTPPHDRLPVETIVTQYDERVIRDAIQRELNRGGQVFFLHNRVMTIETMATKLRALVPQARIGVGHGQMHSDELEEVMTAFVNGEYDVLLSTTIIESGLDIPNANTIIIDRADRFGLSDLYQLRGRVGRYKHQAYAYLLLPRHAGLLADVRKRLSAIKQYSTLGSGFKIAMRDLEIRGAGNLLGAEQSGHITAVGFELYCQLLKQSVASQKGETVKPRIEVQVRLDFLALSPTEERPAASQTAARTHPSRRLPGGVLDEAELTQASEATSLAASANSTASQAKPAFIPFQYISDSRQRIEIYRRLAQATDKTGLESLAKELRDRFGPLPPALDLLLQVADLKILAAARAISTIEVREDKLMLTRGGDYVMVGSKFPRLTRRQPAARLKEIRKLLLAL
jgi:transcription-repair coupling factor (superfamily II helicase)